jgi:aminocarboxymuconate-semialdehyde decarboxylase
VIVDTHSHVLPRAMIEALERDPDRYDATFERKGESYGLVVKGRRRGDVEPEKYDAERRLAGLDAAGIDVQVLSPTPTFYSYWMEPELAAEIAAVTNDGIAAMVAESDRFWGIGQLPLQSTGHALAELEHVRELRLLGIAVGANVEQKELDDESLEPVWARLNELQMTVFVHPVNPTLLARMEPYHLTNLIGNPLDTTIALSRLILSGVLLRHPDIRFYFAHAGGFMPYLYGRIDHAWHARDDTSSVIDVVPSTLLYRVWFDTIAHARPPLEYLISSMGDDRVVVGTDYPADMADIDIAGTLGELRLDPGARDRIEHRNAERLFGRAT